MAWGGHGEKSHKREWTNTAENEVTPLNYQITSYGADYPVDALVTRKQAGDIFVPPFQRKYVWTTGGASSFVSLCSWDCLSHASFPVS